MDITRLPLQVGTCINCEHATGLREFHIECGRHSRTSKATWNSCFDYTTRRSLPLQFIYCMDCQSSLKYRDRVSSSSERYPSGQRVLSVPCERLGRSSGKYCNVPRRCSNFIPIVNGPWKQYIQQ
jgi:hypothetical protein